MRRRSLGGSKAVLGGAVGCGLLLLALHGCDASGPTGPRGPGSIQVVLLSPNGAEGAGVFEITGGLGLGEVSAQSGEVYQESSGGTIHLVVVRDLPGEIRFQIRSENVREVPAVHVVQVAGGDNDLRSSLDGYEVEVVQIEDEVAP
jgi:hypothetical protein